MKVPDCSRSRHSRNAQRKKNFHVRYGNLYSLFACPLMNNQEDFLVPSAVSQPNIVKAGTCPHGLPLGACPICSGMGGGGSSVRKADFSAKPGEMSWNECAAIGAFLKAQREAKLARQQDALNWANSLANFEKSVMNVSQKISAFMSAVARNFPPVAARPLNFIVQNLVFRPLNLLSNVAVGLRNFMTKSAEIFDKLNAIYGELKAAINKKAGEIVSAVRKKLKSVFALFGAFEEKDDDEKTEEAKKSFKLRTFIHDLYGKITGHSKKDKEENDGSKV